MYSTLYIEQYFYARLLSSLIIDTFWHFHNHPVKCFGHTHLNKEDKFRPEAHTCSCSHLATKARLLSEAKGKVQHIQLFVCGFILDLCKIFLKELKLTHLMTPHRM